MEEVIFSLKKLIGLLLQIKNRSELSSASYFSSIVKEIQSDKNVSGFRLQKEIDEQAIRDTVSFINQMSKDYFLENEIENISVSQRIIQLQDMMHAHTLYKFFDKQGIKPLWKSFPGAEKDSFIYEDNIGSVLMIELKSHQLYIPTSLIYFGVVPCKEGNQLFSIQISTYLDFKKEERFPKSLSFFRHQKGKVVFKDWDSKQIKDFFEQSLKELFDQLIEKMNERKRSLKN